MCVQPWKIPDLDQYGNLAGMKVPCGKCWQCALEYTKAWTFRAGQEAKRSWRIDFYTFTYNDDFCPVIYDSYGLPLMTLKKRDIQAFFKKLRKACNCPGMRYYCVGEYSPDSYQLNNGIWTSGNRPHYHIILFNGPSPEQVDKAWSNFSDSRGFIKRRRVDDVSKGIWYLTKYLNKKFEWISDDIREKPKPLSSKGFGRNYLSPSVLAYHRSCVEHCFLTVAGNGKVFRQSMPRYYGEHIYRPVGMYKEVTDYKMERSFHLEERQFAKLKNEYSKLSEERILEIWNERRQRKPMTYFDL